ncbi:hypothetical protein ACFWIB_14720 [Streptomyces sp. NPDC127051]|uniref:hypothetical protein n=1 Tax=Streptomyces sp. NPDC127051 TaxID=3347119 RepID=UPI00365B53AC
MALYVRRLAEAEEPKSFVNLSTLVRQMSDSLGLTTPGMRANRWRIDREAEVAPRSTGPVVPAANSARARLRAVPGGSG